MANRTEEGHKIKPIRTDRVRFGEELFNFLSVGNLVITDVDRGRYFVFEDVYDELSNGVFFKRMRLMKPCCEGAIQSLAFSAVGSSLYTDPLIIYMDGITLHCNSRYVEGADRFYRKGNPGYEEKTKLIEVVW